MISYRWVRKGSDELFTVRNQLLAQRGLNICRAHAFTFVLWTLRRSTSLQIYGRGQITRQTVAGNPRFRWNIFNEQADSQRRRVTWPCCLNPLGVETSGRRERDISLVFAESFKLSCRTNYRCSPPINLKRDLSPESRTFNSSLFQSCSV